jgi:transcriptional regulator with XRE-family HTH domain
MRSQEADFMQKADVVATGPPPSEVEHGGGDLVGLRAGRATVITLEEFAQRMPLVQPPCAYRLSLDSGVEFNNVKHAFEQPMAVRLDTWLRLLRSLGVSLVAAASREDVASDDPSLARVHIGGADADPGPRLAPSRQSTLQDCRRVRGLSMASLASQIGVSIDTVTSVERGRGLLRNVARVCQQFGLNLYVALPGRFRSVDDLWAAHAERYLLAPSQFPLRRPTRKFEGPQGDGVPMPRRRTGPPRKPRSKDA